MVMNKKEDIKYFPDTLVNMLNSIPISASIIVNLYDYLKDLKHGIINNTFTSTDIKLLFADSYLKYILTGESKIENDIILNRIMYVRDIETKFGIIKAGTLGGWIQYESNLSHNGNSGVFGNSIVLGDDSIVMDNGAVYGGVVSNSIIMDNAIVVDNVTIEDSSLEDNAWVSGTSIIHNSHIYDNIKVSGYSKIYNLSLNGDYTIIDNKVRITTKSPIQSTVKETPISNILSKNEEIDQCFKTLDETINRLKEILKSN